MAVTVSAFSAAMQPDWRPCRHQFVLGPEARSPRPRRRWRRRRNPAGGFRRSLQRIERSRLDIGYISFDVKDYFPPADPTTLTLRPCGENGLGETCNGARATREGVTDSSKQNNKAASPTRPAAPHPGSSTCCNVSLRRRRPAHFAPSDTLLSAISRVIASPVDVPRVVGARAPVARGARASCGAPRQRAQSTPSGSSTDERPAGSVVAVQGGNDAFLVRQGIVIHCFDNLYRFFNVVDRRRLRYHHEAGRRHQ